MRFEDFCRAHGLIVDSLVSGRWVRVPTVDHPRKKNGAYKFMGNVGWCQNHATHVDVSCWKPDGDAPEIDTARIVQQAQEFERRMVEGWKRAASKAALLIKQSSAREHPYLARKGFPTLRGLVQPDGSLLIPMRHLHTNDVTGAQLIRWLPDELKFEKKMMPGMRAKGAVFRLGSPKALRTWLVEGFATGLSVEAALALLNLRDAVLVCFSAGNLIHVAGEVPGQRLVFADHDESDAGQRAAVQTGLPYCMSGELGDANDLHQRAGLFSVANLLMDAIASKEPAMT